MSYHLQEINRRIQADSKEFVDASDAAYAAKIERAAPPKTRTRVRSCCSPARPAAARPPQP